MRIGICGSHGVGKTTIVRTFSKKHRIPKIKEGIRNTIDYYNLHDEYKKGCESLQFVYIYNHILDIITSKNFISDRTVLDNYAYYLTLDDYQFKCIYKDLVEQYSKYYDYIFYIPIEFKPKDDGFRFDEKFQKKVDKIIYNILNDMGIEYYTLTGTTNERLKKIENTVF